MTPTARGGKDPRRGKRALGARHLGIDLTSRRERELFKWFLACLLFGKPIQQEVACRAYHELAHEGMVTPRAILDAGWDRLVAVLDRGHYVRFDFSTATKLLEVSRVLLERYGSLTALLRAAEGRADAARRLQEFKGVGPTTARIFLREIGGARRAWSRAVRDTSRVRRRSGGSRAGPRPRPPRGRRMS